MMAKRCDWPNPSDTPLAGLELFLTGTPAELDAAARVLGRIGQILYASPRHRLAGADTGRWRVYVRLHVATIRAELPPVLTENDAPTLPDLAA
jgi:hypothetical protein